VLVAAPISTTPAALAASFSCVDDPQPPASCDSGVAFKKAILAFGPGALFVKTQSSKPNLTHKIDNFFNLERVALALLEACVVKPVVELELLRGEDSEDLHSVGRMLTLHVRYKDTSMPDAREPV
jgi:hypothetical protein